MSGLIAYLIMIKSKLARQEFNVLKWVLAFSMLLSLAGFSAPQGSSSFLLKKAQTEWSASGKCVSKVNLTRFKSAPLFLKGQSNWSAVLLYFSILSRVLIRVVTANFASIKPSIITGDTLILQSFLPESPLSA
jgi:hypothetical protein